MKGYFLDIDLESRRTCEGYFDKYTRKVYWVYSDDLSGVSNSNQMVLNVDYGSITPTRVNAYSAGFPRIVGVNESQPYTAGSSVTNVTANGVQVEVNTDRVDSTVIRRSSSTREAVYLVIDNTDTTISYSLGNFRDGNFQDWSSLGGVDSGAYLVVNSVTGGTGRYDKQVPYLTVFFRSTEDGIDAQGDYVNASSCLLSTRWNWTDSQNANKWTVPRQTYRIRRAYTDQQGSFDDGKALLSTRTKIRGTGRSVAFRFEAEESKDMHIYGWAFNLQRTGQE